MAEANSGTIQKLIQAGAVGICFALIALIYQSNENERAQTEKMTELVEVTRALPLALHAAVSETAEVKTKEILLAVQNSCSCTPRY